MQREALAKRIHEPGNALLSTEIELFKGLPLVDQAQLLGRMEKIILPDGTVLFEAGDSGDCMYIVSHGQLELQVVAEDMSRYTLSILGMGEACGEMSLLTGDVRSAAAIAKGDVELYVIDHPTFLQIAAEYPSIARYFLRLLSNRLVHTNSRLHKARNDHLLLVNEDLGQVSERIRRIIMAAAVLPPDSESFMMRFFGSSYSFPDIAASAGLCKHILDVEKREQRVYIHPASRGVISDLYGRERTSEKEQLISAAVEFFIENDCLEQALQTLADNRRWQAAMELIESRMEEFSADERLGVSLCLALEGCPSEIIYYHFDIFRLFLERGLMDLSYHAWNKLDNALHHGLDLFSNAQLLSLYDLAAEYCKKLGDWSQAMEYLNLALQIYNLQEEDDDAQFIITGAYGRERVYQKIRLRLNIARGLIQAAANSHNLHYGRKINLALVLGAALLSLLLAGAISADPGGLSERGIIFIGVSAFTCLLWITRRFPDYMVAMLMLLLWPLFGLASPAQALAGFSSYWWFTLLGILGLEAAVAKTGLIYRLTLTLQTRFQPTYRGQLLGLAFCGLLLGPLQPFKEHRVTAIIPLVQGIYKSMGYQDRSAPAAGLVLGTLLFWVFSAPFVMTAAALNMVVLGMMNGEASVMWLEWLGWSLPGLILFYLMAFLAVYFIYAPRNEYRRMDESFFFDRRMILGHWTEQEKWVLGAVAGFLLMLATQPLHHINVAWIVLGVLLVLLFRGVLDASGLKSMVNWPFLILAGLCFSWAGLARIHGIDVWSLNLVQALLPGGLYSPVITILLIAVLAFLVSLLLRSDMAVIPLALVMQSWADAAGMHYWIIVLIILLASDLFVFKDQSTSYHTASKSLGGRAFTRSQGRKMAAIYIFILFTVIIASTEFWRYIGLM